MELQFFYYWKITLIKDLLVFFFFFFNDISFWFLNSLLFLNVRSADFPSITFLFLIFFYSNMDHPVFFILDFNVVLLYIFLFLFFFSYCFGEEWFFFPFLGPCYKPYINVGSSFLNSYLYSCYHYLLYIYTKKKCKLRRRDSIWLIKLRKKIQLYDIHYEYIERWIDR